MFLKFASADAQVLGFKGAPSKIRTASLSKFGEYEDYRTDDDYLYVRVRAISSRVNKNHDGWPADELQKSWRTFIGKPIFVDHHNHDPKKARGVVVDAALHVEDLEKTSSLDPYYATAPDNHKPPTWIELLLEVDAKTFPRLASAVIDGDIDGVSTGCNVERSRCSVCSNWARSPEEYCKHITSKGAYFDHKQSDGSKVSKRSYEDCYDIGFFEISFVFDPADETALVRDLKTARTASVKKDVYHEAGLFEGDPGGTYGDPNSIDMNLFPAAAMMDQDTAAGMGIHDPAAPVPGPDDASLHLTQLMGGDYQLASQVALMFQQALATHNDPVSAAHLVGQTLLHHGFPGELIHQALDLLIEGVAVPTDNLPYAQMPQGMDDQLPPEMNNPMLSKTADQNPLPQSEMTTMPEKVDTLRKEQICPVCGSSMEDGVCEVCNYEEPPEGFDNPDLEKAKERREQETEKAPVAPDAPPNPLETPGGEVGPSGPPPTSAPAGGAQMPMAASYKSKQTNGVTNDMGTWKVVTKTHTAASNSGGRINTQERPILPASRQNSDKASGARVVKDSLAPVESNNKETRMDHNHKVADGVGATPAGEGVSADKRVDVQGVGAVDNSPEKNTQHVNVEKEVNVKGIHTDTWSGDEGDSLGQHEPVTDQVGSEGMTAPIGQPVSHTHLADGAWGSPGEGGGKSFPDHEPTRIDVQAPLLEERGPDTMTFGADDFHITDPVTNELGSGGMSAPIGEAFPTEGLSPKSDDSLKRSHSLRSHIFRAMKLAETEVELGITTHEAKWQRAAELEEQTPVALDAVEATLARVKTAGLQKHAAAAPIQKKAHSLPSFQAPVTQTEAPDSGDEQLFI